MPKQWTHTAAPKIWNSLPQLLRDTNSKETFKKLLKKKNVSFVPPPRLSKM